MLGTAKSNLPIIEKTLTKRRCECNEKGRQGQNV